MIAVATWLGAFFFCLVLGLAARVGPVAWIMEIEAGMAGGRASRKLASMILMFLIFPFALIPALIYDAVTGQGLFDREADDDESGGLPEPGAWRKVQKRRALGDKPDSEARSGRKSSRRGEPIPTLEAVDEDEEASSLGEPVPVRRRGKRSKRARPDSSTPWTRDPAKVAALIIGVVMGVVGLVVVLGGMVLLVTQGRR
jgi:hypothetical protein